jgi:hypothetical protein
VGSAFVGGLLHGEARPAVVLGAFPTAMYLGLGGGQVIALLTRDAVRLPLGLALSTHSADDPLHRWSGPVRIGASQVRVGDRSVRLSRVVSVEVPTGLEPSRRAIAYADSRLGCLAQVEPGPGLLEALLSGQRALAPAAVVDRLLGVGPGLTPSGDDIVAGFLVGARSFGLAEDPFRDAVLEAAPGGTTDLSAALLRCAARGEAIPEVSALLTALSQRADSSRALDGALRRLGRIGHTSGTALAAGVLAAGQAATESQSSQLPSVR